MDWLNKFKNMIHYMLLQRLVLQIQKNTNCLKEYVKRYFMQIKTKKQMEVALSGRMSDKNKT